jgi:glucosamine--fructose-6-phosphate aminotransferase (isomerizing)
MCGVIGYVGSGASPEFFYQGLKRLEYRGYDSAGIAMLCDDDITIIKAQGKLSELKAKLDLLPSQTQAGIGHTRWATHGKPSEANAHPHRSGPIVLLHNGIIENYSELKTVLIEKGYHFSSETDTEVATHLLHEEYRNTDKSFSPYERMRIALPRLTRQLKGSYAFAIICLDTPDKLYAVKHGSPLALGRGQNAFYLASGIAALVEHTQEVAMLDDGDIAYLGLDDMQVYSLDQSPRTLNFFKVSWSAAMLDKGDFEHYMLKEIYEHPQAVAQSMSGRINPQDYSIDLQAYGLTTDVERLSKINRIDLIACGTSFYASNLARYTLEELLGIPVQVDLASEYRYRASTSNKDTLACAISQSGETIDTLFAIKSAKNSGALTLAVVNAPGSSIGLACDMETIIGAGPEIGVASTKAFTAQLVSLYMLGLALAQIKNVSTAPRKQLAKDMLTLPGVLHGVLNISDQCRKLANDLVDKTSLLFMGRGPQWAVAQEGALKFKELSYVFAESYAAGELKHGPIALIDENLPVVSLAPRDKYYEKTISNIEEVKARGGIIVAIGENDDARLQSLSDFYIGLPSVPEKLQPFVTTIPMHLLAYWMACAKGNDVDQPRNLAKSVTVE